MAAWSHPPDQIAHLSLRSDQQPAVLTRNPLLTRADPPPDNQQVPRRTLLTVVATIAVMVAILAFHPSDQLATVRRAIGLGQERALPAPSVVRSGGAFS